MGMSNLWLILIWLKILAHEQKAQTVLKLSIISHYNVFINVFVIINTCIYIEVQTIEKYFRLFFSIHLNGNDGTM